MADDAYAARVVCVRGFGRSVAPVAFVVVMTCGACGAQGGTSERSRRSASSTVRLAVERETSNDSTVLVPSTATLSCDATDAAGGYLADHATAACAVVRTGALERVARAQSTRRICSQIYSGPEFARIHGTIDARSIDIIVTRRDGCETGDWSLLAALLGDPARRFVPDDSKGVAAGAVPTTTSSGPSEYQVQRGDTVTSIAAHFAVRAADLVSFNHLTDPDHLTQGQTLLIPRVTERLDVAPALGVAGTAFTLTLHGALPGEAVSFTIATPTATTTGPSHVAGSDGVVKAHYQSAAGDTPGIVTVTAQGTAGTHVQGAFLMAPPSTAPAP